MAACTACSTENPEGAQFCMSCGASLALSRAVALDERKVVTALFCDLVGFTATSEAADPEDVDRMLRAYFAMARSQVEAYGGVVEKFIGDAIVGVFGVPAAHEDDPERAVRAGLRIAEAAADLQSVGGTPLRLRVGINTGEVLVRLGVEPGSGERFLAGDAINTASRIQSVAPEGGVAVGLATYQATRAVFTYDELPPATVKGKAAPVRVFHPGAPLARLGADLTRSYGTPFVGRAIDLALLTSRFDKAVAANAPQLVTVIGEPGLGKSRIVAELLRHVDAQPGLVTWRQGRSLPYGQGITFWALGEILKAHAGILESDDPQTAAAKLEAVLPVGEERSWFRARLLPLLGIEASSSGEREEQFTAWRRFLEHVAERGPTVLVFEDLHWADPALLAFLEHLADRAEGVPLLVIGTARPELFARYPDFGRGLRNHTPVRLDPLTPDETERLVGALLETAEVPPGLRTTVLERAGGNPLYAEEFVRLLMDRDLLIAGAAGLTLRPEATIPLPDSVAALIAARLDTLAPDRKAMLADAAVVGKVFWAGAVAAMGGRDPADVAEAMRELARRELVRPARRSSMEGEQEYAFWHVLARDVAYAQLPRPARAARHVAAAAWIESKAPDRVEDVAEVLAHHYATALELTRAAGRSAEAADLVRPAVHFLRLAGRRSLGLRTTDALTTLERALALTPADDPDRPALLMDVASAAYDGARNTEARAALEAAVEAYMKQGDDRAAADALVRLSAPARVLGDPGAGEMILRAYALLAPLGPSPALVRALIELAGEEVSTGAKDAAVRYADEALAMADALGLPRPARALHFRGWARVSRTDDAWQDDFREAIALARAADDGRELVLVHLNYANHLSFVLGLGPSLPILQEGLALSDDRGIAGVGDWIRMNLASVYADTGDWDRALAAVMELLPRAEAHSDASEVALLRTQQVDICTMRGDLGPAAAYCDDLERWGTELATDGNQTYWLSVAAKARIALGEPDRARAILVVIAAEASLRQVSMWWECLGPMLRAALALGELGLAERLADRTTSVYALGDCALAGATALLAEARGDHEVAIERFREAAAAWDAFGQRHEHAQALLGQGRCLLALGRPEESRPVLEDARCRFEALGARPAASACEDLLAVAQSA